MADVKPTDAELMTLVQTRDAGAFDTLRLRYSALVLKHLQSIVHDPDAAQDLLQETLLRVWTRAEQWDGRGTVRGWLLKISTNVALNLLRSTNRKKEFSLSSTREAEDEELSAPGWMIDSISPGPEEALENAERTATLRELVNGLPEEKRELIRLVYDAEIEVREAARMLGIPEGTAKSRLHYTARQLAREWRNLEDE